MPEWNLRERVVRFNWVAIWAQADPGFLNGGAQGRVHPDVYWLRISEDSTAHTRLITTHILAKLHSHHYPGSGPALASAGPDWKHFWGALLSGVCRNFWGETSSHNDRNQRCERARPKCATPSKGGLGASHSFTSPAETSMDNSVTLNKSYTQCFPPRRLRNMGDCA